MSIETTFQPVKTLFNKTNKRPKRALCFSDLVTATMFNNTSDKLIGGAVICTGAAKIDATIDMMDVDAVRACVSENVDIRRLKRLGVLVVGAQRFTAS